MSSSPHINVPYLIVTADGYDMAAPSRGSISIEHDADKVEFLRAVKNGPLGSLLKNFDDTQLDLFQTREQLAKGKGIAYDCAIGELVTSDNEPFLVTIPNPFGTSTELQYPPPGLLNAEEESLFERGMTTIGNMLGIHSVRRSSTDNADTEQSTAK